MRFLCRPFFSASLSGLRRAATGFFGNAYGISASAPQHGALRLAWPGLSAKCCMWTRGTFGLSVPRISNPNTIFIGIPPVNMALFGPGIAALWTRCIILPAPVFLDRGQLRRQPRLAWKRGWPCRFARHLGNTGSSKKICFRR